MPTGLTGPVPEGTPHPRARPARGRAGRARVPARARLPGLVRRQRGDHGVRHRRGPQPVPVGGGDDRRRDRTGTLRGYADADGEDGLGMAAAAPGRPGGAGCATGRRHPDRPALPGRQLRCGPRDAGRPPGLLTPGGQETAYEHERLRLTARPAALARDPYSRRGPPRGRPATHRRTATPQETPATHDEVTHDSRRGRPQRESRPATPPRQPRLPAAAGGPVGWRPGVPPGRPGPAPPPSPAAGRGPRPGPAG